MFCLVLNLFVFSCRGNIKNSFREGGTFFYVILFTIDLFFIRLSFFTTKWCFTFTVKSVFWSVIPKNIHASPRKLPGAKYFKVKYEKVEGSDPKVLNVFPIQYYLFHLETLTPSTYFNISILRYWGIVPTMGCLQKIIIQNKKWQRPDKLVFILGGRGGGNSKVYWGTNPFVP